MNKIAEQQQIIRDLSPQYLAQNQPVGTMAVLADITKRFGLVEFRKPFVRKPEEDETYGCFNCRRDGYYFVDGSQEDCIECGGSGEHHFTDNQVVLTVWRGGHSIETVATLMPGGKVTAYVNVAQPGFPEWKWVELTEEEQELVINALRAEPEPPKASDPSDTE